MKQHPRSHCLAARGCVPIAVCVVALHLGSPAFCNENAALHYHRAILFLGAVDPDLREILSRPVWETVPTLEDDQRLQEASRLLMTSRHAIRSALVGSRREQADFGLDEETFVQSPLLPHCAPMGDLANLVCLYGLQLQSDQRWKQAADAYLAVLRMGRHMTHQATLAEAVVGARMLEAGFYGLSLWAAQCPDPNLAGETLAAIEKLSEGMFDLQAVMTSELKLRTLRQEQLVQQFPDGPWAEMLLDVLEVDAADDDPASVRETAIAAATQRGVPPDVFRDRDALVDYVTKLQSLYADYTEAVLDAVRLASTGEQIMRGVQVYEEFAPRFQELGNPAEIHPGKLVAFLASHRAERTITRTALAIAAARTAAGFPEKLDDVAGRLGGSVPASPYDGSPLVYEVSQDRRAYVLTIPEVTIGETVLPTIEFKSKGVPVEPR